MATRSATRSRSDVMWVEKSTVRLPGSARSMIICKNCRRAKGSRLAAGSSRISSSGSWPNASTMASRLELADRERV